MPKIKKIKNEKGEIAIVFGKSLSLFDFKKYIKTTYIYLKTLERIV